MTLPITTAFAAIAALILIALSVSVILRRRAASVALGAGGDEMLERKIRAQANFVEYAPFAVILVGLAEAQGAGGAGLAALAALFIAARLAHGYAMSLTANAPKSRLFGIAATLTVVSLLALWNLWLVIA